MLFRPRDSNVWTPTFHPLGDVLVTASIDQTTRFWAHWRRDHRLSLLRLQHRDGGRGPRRRRRTRGACPWFLRPRPGYQRALEHGTLPTPRVACRAGLVLAQTTSRRDWWRRRRPSWLQQRSTWVEQWRN